VFHNELQYRHVSARINIGDDATKSSENVVNFGPVSPEIARVYCEIVQTIGQKKLGKNWHIAPNISECTKPIFSKFSKFGKHVNGSN